MTKFNIGECDEKCHYASKILYEWPHGKFVVLLSYYLILRENDFLIEI